MKFLYNKYIFFIYLNITYIFNIVHAATWLPEHGQYFTSFENSILVKKTRLLLIHEKKKEETVNKILGIKKEVNRMQNSSYQNLTDSVIEEIVNFKNKKIDVTSSNLEKNNIQSFTKASSFFSMEYGLTNNVSLGFTSNIALNELVGGNEFILSNFSIFSKYKLYEKKSLYISTEIGGNIMENHKSFFGGVNLAFIKNHFNKKIISEINFKLGSDTSKNFYTILLSNTIDLNNGYYIKLEKYFDYNPKANNYGKYFTREKINISKKINSANIYDKDEIYLTLSFYSDYLAKTRKKVSDGISIGIFGKF